MDDTERLNQCAAAILLGDKDRFAPIELIARKIDRGARVDRGRIPLLRRGHGADRHGRAAP